MSMDEKLWASVPDEFVVFDTETTGLDARSARILEIGALLFVKKDYLKTNEVKVFQCFIKHDKPIPPAITAINGITDEMVKDGKTEHEALSEFLDFTKNRPLYAYNSNFDVKFIRAAAKRSGLVDASENFESTDVMDFVKETFDDLPNKKLTTVAQRINQPTTGAHRAVNDCAMTLQVLIYCIQTIAAKEDWATNQAREAQQHLNDKSAKSALITGLVIVIGLLFLMLRK